jgi:methyltransferase (TIGR00027 family)
MGVRQVASAQQLTFARAHLTDTGVLNDPLAKQFLHPGANRLAKALVRLERTGLWRNRPFVYVAARTRFYDAAVTDALDAGVRQVVILGAGYDSRAWRLGRESVAFFEVDLPDVQEDKRRLAPPGGPIFVSVDLLSDPLGKRLLASGFDPTQPTLFVCEGLTMFLPRSSLVRLLDEIAHLAAPKSRLAVDFAAGAKTGPWLWRIWHGVIWSLYYIGGNPLRFELSPTEAPRFLADRGWQRAEVLYGTALFTRYLSDTEFPIARSLPGAYVVTAQHA